MTRVALLSDIHGNLTALEAVLADIARQGPFDGTVVAGDLVWAGPWPAEVVDLTRASGAIVIQGNTDAFFRRSMEDPAPGKREGRFAEHLTWMMDRLGPERTRYLAHLPFSHRISPAAGHDLLVVHANPQDLERAIMAKASEAELDGLLLADGGDLDWDALAFGHVHTPFTRAWRSRILVDVASAGLPMDGDPRAVYAILTWDRGHWQAEHRRVRYDVPVVAHRMRTSGMPRGKHFAERLTAAAYSVHVAAQMVAVTVE